MRTGLRRKRRSSRSIIAHALYISSLLVLEASHFVLLPSLFVLGASLFVPAERSATVPRTRCDSLQNEVRQSPERSATVSRTNRDSRPNAYPLLMTNPRSSGLASCSASRS